jgi:CRISPR-associated endonuclease Csy4
MFQIYGERMKQYVEITLLPCAEMPLHILTQQVYQALHLKFVEMKNENGLQPVGVSFPKYDTEANTLGEKIRLFAPDVETLERFNAKQTLRKLSDYVHVTSIRDVPTNVKTFGCFSRLQLKTNNLRLARRKAKRENVAVAVSLSKFVKHAEKRTTAPFVVIKSVSNGENFRLFVVYNEQANDNSAGFGTYGLSSKSTVPIF